MGSRVIETKCVDGFLFAVLYSNKHLSMQQVYRPARTHGSSSNGVWISYDKFRPQPVMCGR